VGAERGAGGRVRERRLFLWRGGAPGCFTVCFTADHGPSRICREMALGLKTRNRLEETSADLGADGEASESDTGPESTRTQASNPACQQRDCVCRRSCDLAAIMKCAAIALALQGATGLVAPRLTVKSSALQAATLEASPSDATKVILAKAIAARASRRPKNQPAAVQMHARCSPASAVAKSRITHTSARDGAAAPQVAKRLESAPPP
jgi:hypothetical protein